jgi:surfeit locus 1 family protein
MKRWLLIAIAAFATAGFTALGIWQVERRAWKLALIERVEQRVHAEPVTAPGPGEWRALSRENAEYRRVKLTGRWLVGRQTLVRAVTALGEGFWLMEPLQTNEGFVVWVNRGFVPQGWRSGDAAVFAGATGAAELTTTVTGLLRISEPHGAFLRANAPAEDRWYSRDVDAISNARHLTDAAPYFVDAEAATGAAADTSRPPVAGLTAIHFRNSHLQYVITWFTLALMALALGVRVARTR